MKVSATAIAAGAIGIFCLVSYAWSARGNLSASELRKHRHTEIRGVKVEDRNGHELGKVSDLVVDLGSGEVRYALIQPGGLSGRFARLRIVPSYALSMATAKRNIFALNTTKSTWKKVSSFKSSDLAQLARPERSRQIAALFQRPTDQRNVAHADSTAATPGPTPTGREKASQFQLASDVVGKEVINQQQENVGEVTDLLIDFTGRRPTLAIISAGRLLKEEQTFALPLRSLSLTTKDKVMIAVDRLAFEQAPPFSEKAWESAASVGPGSIYRYEDSEPDNTARNARDRNGDSLTPSKQSETNSDRQITQRIRRGLATNSELSFNAKNIKIITVNGQVALRGPVRNEQERTQIVNLASQIAGAENVESQIEIKGK